MTAMMDVDYAPIIERLMTALNLNQKGLADRLGVSQSTISKWLKGQTVEVKNRMAIAHLVGETFGEETAVARRAPVAVVGLASAGSDEIAFGDGQGPFGDVEIPNLASPATVAVEIRGSSLGRLLDGWMALYDDRRDPPDESLLGCVCVCGLPDGRVMVKRLRQGSKAGLYHLESAVEGTLFDQRVTWAAKVRGFLPR